MIIYPREAKVYISLSNTLLFCHDLACRFPRLTLGFVTVVTLLAAPQIPRLNSIIALHDIVDNDLPSAEKFQSTKESFLTGNTAFTVFDYQEVVTQIDLLHLQTFVNEQKLTNWQLLSTQSVFEARSLTRSSSTSWFMPLVTDNPDHLSKLHKTPWFGLLVDESFTKLGIEFSFKDSENTSKYGSFDPKPVGKLYEDLESKFPSIETKVVGGAPFAFFTLEGIRYNGKLNFLGLIILLVLFWLLFRSIKPGVLLILTLVISSIWILGGLAYFQIPMDILLSGVILMILLASLEDYIFLCYVRQSNDWRQSFRKLIVPSFLTSLTTCVGFGSLYFTDLDIIQKFGLVCACGSMIEWGMMFLFLPALIKVFPQLASWPTQDKWRLNWMENIK